MVIGPPADLHFWKLICPRSAAHNMTWKHDECMPLITWFLVTRIWLESYREKWWLDAVFHRMTRLESESFLQNLWAFEKKQFVYTQRNEHFSLQWWLRLAKFFCFACLVVLCHILSIKCPQLAQRYIWDFTFTERSAGHNILTPYRSLM